jgi:hypothetical protein
MEKSFQITGNRWNGSKPFFSALSNPTRRADFLFIGTEQVMFLAARNAFRS